MAVFVLDKHKKPLMPCSEKRARLLLERNRARVHRIVPFTIRLVDRLKADSVLQPIRLKLDPGSKVTGIALVREKETVNASTGEFMRTLAVIMLMELQHRGITIRNALIQRRDHRHFRRVQLRYRQARFNNRTRKDDWLAPSLQHRVDSILSWVARLRHFVPVSALSQEFVRFDTQAMQNPEISGKEYQQGTLAGYEVREYLLEKWGRKCAYCDAENVPLELEHIVARSRGGSNRVSNLTLACVPCNQKKGNQSIETFLARQPERLRRILVQTKASLQDAAYMNSTRWVLLRRLKTIDLNVEAASGSRTKWNRHRLRVPKEHCLDALCVGYLDGVENWRQPVLRIKATGRGCYQRTLLTKYGFPRGYLVRNKSAFGFQTGDVVKAVVTTGSKTGTYLGRVAIRARGSFNIQSGTGLVQGIHHRFCTLLQRADGYGYSWEKWP